MTEYYVIEDWMSKRLFPDKVFTSYYDARDFISEYADRLAYEKYPNDEAKREELYNGYCEDMYAIAVDEQGDEILK